MANAGERPAVLRPRIGRHRSAGATVPTDHLVASHLVVQAARRLEIVSSVALVAVLLLWLLVNFFECEIANEFASPAQWAPPIAALTSSAAMLLIARSGRWSSATLIRIGLVYEVVMSVSVACGAYLVAFHGLAASELTNDRIGVNGVVPWTMFFTVLVPARPREALVALVISNAFVPLLYLQQVQIGAAPALSVGQFLPMFVLPYAANTVLAYVAARVVHSLGVEVRRAHDLGSYRLDVLLGRGGMGEVWRASHRMLARPAAIKLIRRDTLARDPSLAATAIDRFEREAQVIASLQSPHTVALYDFGVTDDGSLFYVMELLEGVNLEVLVRKFWPLPPERVVYLLRQVCSSLAEAHHRGLVHRDIKPANIYLCHRGMEHDVVKVLDFGIVKKAVTDDEPAVRALTGANDIAGTPDFMAPEIATGASNIDGRADIYALGCVAFWLLTARPVFEEATPLAAIIAHVRGHPIPPSTATEFDVPAALDQIILDCLAKDPEARPALEIGGRPMSEATEAAELRGLPRDQRLSHPRPAARPADLDPDPARDLGLAPADDRILPCTAAASRTCL
jgi:eukaryotic-like serine/threonine-protein kinase